MKRRVVHPMHLAPMASTSPFCVSVFLSSCLSFHLPPSHLPRFVNHSFIFCSEPSALSMFSNKGPTLGA